MYTVINYSGKGKELRTQASEGKRMNCMGFVILTDVGGTLYTRPQTPTHPRWQREAEGKINAKRLYITSGIY